MTTYQRLERSSGRSRHLRIFYRWTEKLRATEKYWGGRRGLTKSRDTGWGLTRVLSGTRLSKIWSPLRTWERLSSPSGCKTYCLSLTPTLLQKRLSNAGSSTRKSWPRTTETPSTTTCSSLTRSLTMTSLKNGCRKSFEFEAIKLFTNHLDHLWLQPLIWQWFCQKS